MQTRVVSSQPSGYEALLAGSRKCAGLTTVQLTSPDLSHGSGVHSPPSSAAYHDDFHTPNPYDATSTGGSSRPASQMYLSNPSENEPGTSLPPGAAQSSRKKRNSQQQSPSFRQEADAGRVEMEVIPPEYDPTWAKTEGEGSGQSRPAQ